MELYLYNYSKTATKTTAIFLYAYFILFREDMYRRGRLKVGLTLITENTAKEAGTTLNIGIVFTIL